MADLPTITRTISGKGEIIIPQEYAQAKNIYLYTQVVRRVKTPSLNLTWNPDKGFYAHVTFCIDDYVLQTYDVNFKEQVFYVYDGMLAQIFVSMKCAFRQVLLGTSPIDLHSHNKFNANRIRFECFSSTALKLTLKGKELDLCEPGDSQPEPPPPPPPPAPEVPSSQPIEVDKPYDDDTNNSGTNPNPGDEFKEEPGGENCRAYVINYSYDSISSGQTNRTTNQIITLFGPIGGIIATRTSQGDPQIQIECKGSPDFGMQCGETMSLGVSTLQGAGETVEFANPAIDSIT